jgi:hypothetical protein
LKYIIIIILRMCMFTYTHILILRNKLYIMSLRLIHLHVVMRKCAQEAVIEYSVKIRYFRGMLQLLILEIPDKKIHGSNTF